MYNIVIRHLYTLLCYHCIKCSNHLSPRKVIMVLLTFYLYYIPFYLFYPSTHLPLLWQSSVCPQFLSFLKKRFYLFILRGTGKEGEREGEKHQCVVASCRPPAADLAGNPDMCPEENWTGDLLFHRPELSPLSHTSQGLFLVSMTLFLFCLLICFVGF